MSTERDMLNLLTDLYTAICKLPMQWPGHCLRWCP